MTAPNHRQLAANALRSGHGRGLICAVVIAASVAYAIWTLAFSQPVTRWQELIILAMLITLAVGNIAADQVIRIMAAGFLREATDRAAHAASVRPPGDGGTG